MRVSILGINADRFPECGFGLVLLSRNPQGFAESAMRRAVLRV